ncbi:hypothetical protein [Mycobacterium sp. AZCC_0083]|uniref:hypothetical protein n=1 Tax=Mycobacterium sp. AZCC_0083 TaxID=2735882 RepID=UPI0016107745|nr:hypothetical protein [Mycobacterium sp. AZCC_0083]MBB5164144.1 hypothetical protein [Mycobacterium sp. AZCC_0083]
MSIQKLPEPANWQASRRLLVWITVGVLAFTSFGVYWSVVATIRGHYLTPTALFGISVFPLIATAALLLVSLGRTSLRAETDSDGTVLRPDRLFSTLMIVGFACVVPSGLVFIFNAPTGRLDILMSRGYQIFSPTVMALAVVAAVLGLVSAMRRGGIGYLKVTPVGIDVANMVSTKSVDWDDVVDIKDDTDTKRRTRRAIVFCLKTVARRSWTGPTSTCRAGPRCTGWCGTIGATPMMGPNLPTVGRWSGSVTSRSPSTSRR